MAANLRVDARERSVAEHRIAEQVRRRHRNLQPRLLERRLEVLHDLVALGRGRVARNEIVVVQVHAISAELGELVDDLHGAYLRPRRFAEGIASGIAHGPQAEGEVVLRSGRVGVLCR